MQFSHSTYTLCNPSFIRSSSPVALNTVQRLLHENSSCNKIKHDTLHIRPSLNQCITPLTSVNYFPKPSLSHYDRRSSYPASNSKLMQINQRSPCSSAIYESKDYHILSGNNYGQQAANGCTIGGGGSLNPIIVSKGKQKNKKIDRDQEASLKLRDAIDSSIVVDPLPSQRKKVVNDSRQIKRTLIEETHHSVKYPCMTTNKPRCDLQSTLMCVGSPHLAFETIPNQRIKRLHKAHCDHKIQSKIQKSSTEETSRWRYRLWRSIAHHIRRLQKPSALTAMRYLEKKQHSEKNRYNKRDYVGQINANGTKEWDTSSEQFNEVSSNRSENQIKSKEDIHQKNQLNEDHSVLEVNELKDNNSSQHRYDSLYPHIKKDYLIEDNEKKTKDTVKPKKKVNKTVVVSHIDTSSSSLLSDNENPIDMATNYPYTNIIQGMTTKRDNEKYQNDEVKISPSVVEVYANNHLDQCIEQIDPIQDNSLTTLNNWFVDCITADSFSIINDLLIESDQSLDKHDIRRQINTYPLHHETKPILVDLDTEQVLQEKCAIDATLSSIERGSKNNKGMSIQDKFKNELNHLSLDPVLTPLQNVIDPFNEDLKTELSSLAKDIQNLWYYNEKQTQLCTNIKRRIHGCLRSMNRLSYHNQLSRCNVSTKGLSPSSRKTCPITNQKDVIERQLYPIVEEQAYLYEQDAS